MRLTNNQIDLLSFEMVKLLVKKGLIETENVDQLTEKVAHVITEELMLEDKLNQEVREILSKHSDELRRKEIEYYEMFKMIKAKLVKDRKIII